MMKDADVLSRMHDPLVQQYDITAKALSTVDRTECPQAYTIMPLDALTCSLSPPDGLAQAVAPS